MTLKTVIVAPIPIARLSVATIVSDRFRARDRPARLMSWIQPSECSRAAVAMTSIRTDTQNRMRAPRPRARASRARSSNVTIISSAYSSRNSRG